jgi:ferrochelatase
MKTPKTGLLLINLGTPDSPTAGAVRSYLREFLMDPRVVDLPALGRWLLVHLVILPFRPRKSAEAYAKIWTPQGSPLLVHGEALAAKVADRLGAGAEVALGMRYGNPSIGSALARLRSKEVDRLVVFPLYPQNSGATTGSTLDKLRAETSGHWAPEKVRIVPPFYDHTAFISALAGLARPVLERAEPERVFFSFHGLPERQIRKADPSGAHCLERTDCCERITEANRDCYRAQCFATARLLADRLDLPAERRAVCFQSRLGRTPWIRPYTDELLADAARSGCRRAVILSPAFVADCLETIEELGLRASESWKEHGGESLELVPCLNASDEWADAVVRIAREAAGDWLNVLPTE